MKVLLIGFAILALIDLTLLSIFMAVDMYFEIKKKKGETR